MIKSKPRTINAKVNITGTVKIEVKETKPLIKKSRKRDNEKVKTSIKVGRSTKRSGRSGVKFGGKIELKPQEESKSKQGVTFVDMQSVEKNESSITSSFRKNEDRQFLQDRKTNAKDTEAEHGSYKRSVSSDVGSMGEYAEPCDDIVFGIKSSTFVTNESQGLKYEHHVMTETRLTNSKLFSYDQPPSDSAIGCSISSVLTKLSSSDNTYGGVKFDGTENPIPYGLWDINDIN